METRYQHAKIYLILIKDDSMKPLFIITGLFVVLLNMNCALMINDPYNDGDSPTVHTNYSYSISTQAYFPFENNTNWWKFSEASGNPCAITIVDTISDDNITYYRVSFMENRVDTTDDWFKRSSGDILFGASLTGIYNRFLPSRIESRGGRYTCGNNEINYEYFDSVVINGLTFKKVISLQYVIPVIHGFDKIMFAEKIGVIMMQDQDGRWPVSYVLDSCSISGTISRF
jgi:hypothetical protein